jgi:hypothetical protein
MGNANFAELVGREGQGEAMAKGTVFLAVYMYIIGRLEEALLGCTLGCGTEQTCIDKSERTLDEAVAYYAGSLADHSTDNSTGVFFYALSDNRGQNFKTSGHEPVKNTGTSYVNIHVMSHFKEMQRLLKVGDADSCLRAHVSKKEIIRLMKIPLIQSVLGYAYMKEKLKKLKPRVRLMLQVSYHTFILVTQRVQKYCTTKCELEVISRKLTIVIYDTLLKAHTLV